MPVLPDLITSTYLSTVWSATDAGLTAAEVAALPAHTTSASRAVRAYCNRRFTRAVVDELYTLDGIGAEVLLREFPVNGVVAAMANPTQVLTAWNADAATNQRATVALATSGSVGDFSLAATGITLQRWASGVATGATVLFSAHPTVGSVAAAIAALGGGWQATADPAFALRASADFRPPQGAFGCLGTSPGAGFLIHVDDLPFDLDAEAGILRVDRARDDDPFTSVRWGVFLDTGWGDTSLRGATNGLRVVYDCGFDTVPEDVQYWTAQAVKSFVEKGRTDSTLKSEAGGAYSWSARDAIAALPDPVKDGLAPWRNPRA